MLSAPIRRSDHTSVPERKGAGRSAERQVYNISVWPTPKPLLPLSKKSILVALMPEQEHTAPTRGTVASLHTKQLERGAARAASSEWQHPITHPTGDFRLTKTSGSTQNHFTQDFRLPETRAARGRGGLRTHHVLHADGNLSIAVEGSVETHDVRGVTLVQHLQLPDNLIPDGWFDF